MDHAIQGTRKAAILMVLLGEDASSRILRHFDENEILAIGREVAALGEIAPEVADTILREYREKILSHRESGGGGVDAARRMLTKTLPPDKAAQFGQSLAAGAGAHHAHGGAAGTDPFAGLSGIKEPEIAQTLELEHPQTAALVLLHLEPGRAAAVLESMSEENQAGVTARLARLSSVAADVTREVSDALTARLDSQRPRGLEETDGTGAAAEILKRMERAKSRAIISRLESADGEMAETLRARLYTFEMVLMLADRGVQELLKGVDSKLLGLALKGSIPEVAEKFFKNMSTRAAEMVRDEMEFLTVAKVKDVEAAQKEILDRALKLEEEGVITFEVPADAASAV